MRTARFLVGFVDRLEHAEGLDAAGRPLAAAADRISPTAAGAALRGDWLGRALHPLLTDLSLGCWLSAGVLDLVGGRRSRPAATRLVGVGLLVSPLVAAAGVAEYGTIRHERDHERSRRVAFAHAAGNTLVAVSYLASWRLRRRGRHVAGVGAGLVGGTIAWVTGYLGGHLSFARSVGTGGRGDLDAAVRARADVRSGVEALVSDPIGLETAAELLQVPVRQVHVLIDQGLLTPLRDSGDGVILGRSEVLAVRNLGG